MEDFDRLKKRLTLLLARFDTIHAEKDELKNRLELKELELKSLKEKIDRLEADKTVARKKVTNILHKIEGLTQSA